MSKKRAATINWSRYYAMQLRQECADLRTVIDNLAEDAEKFGQYDSKELAAKSFGASVFLRFITERIEEHTADIELKL